MVCCPASCGGHLWSSWGDRPGYAICPHVRVLVCGSRDWADRATVYSVLDEIAPTTIREGCYRGADKIAEDYALSRHLPCEHYPAQWGTRGKAAGPERNERMLRGEALGRPPEGPPDLVVRS